jgi:hypothetical protein
MAGKVTPRGMITYEIESGCQPLEDYIARVRRHPTLPLGSTQRDQGAWPLRETMADVIEIAEDTRRANAPVDFQARFTFGGHAPYAYDRHRQQYRNNRQEPAMMPHRSAPSLPRTFLSTA